MCELEPGHPVWAGVAKGNDCPSGIGKNDAKELISTGAYFSECSERF